MIVWMPLWVSMRASVIATAIVAVLGVGLGYVLAKGRFPGRGVIEGIASLPMALPPTVVGYYLLTRLNGPGPIRDLSIALTGDTLTFTLPGIVIAQTVESFPYCVRGSRAAIAGVDRRLEQASRAIGLPNWRVALHVTLPLARRGIVAAVAMAFGRALGDYGATDAISGGTAQTTTMPIALYNAVFNGSEDIARTLAYVQIGMSLTILLAVSRLGRTRAW